ncbi:type VI secretion system baseplate subunit TssG [Enterobacter kobei]|uniref:type VI secretion system baseplate subunit TssG n=1 Tax=Enterobacter cloacae complex TaxID=354276 RepID=UPI0005E168B8|nr:type VI secretion system baseplate subunit TssG [Enterobacter kobei]KJI55200.1 type VI secretion protein [Enterobacter kobei]MBD3600216.1 type VI secretion system baseplate subunit TssG [Enterobacter kobei]MBG0590265.1 type VI secretion system baseplate subunit TssG [Enterobacter kobei]MCK6796956.1 type VI secretion system baseplate subunit TssG [Enterobacter kobei]MCK7023461.1 type VI secretion system baseplate subunit TssG [Enterobacter kobei]
MYPVEREPQSAPARLIALLGDRLPYMNFYRFCRLLEQSQPDKPVTGSTWQVRHEPVRFRPHPGMSFPASEIKGIEQPEYPHLPPTVRITFMGLYGVESPLPTHYIDDITQRREGYEATADFLDIFNHRLITQYYRIWRKYSYPATFEEGGKDKSSQYLLGLAGLGINGCTDSIATPASRFLALLPVMLLPGRTAEGMASLVRLLAPNTQAKIWHHDKRRVPLKKPLTMSVSQPVSLTNRPVMGSYATDVNSQVLMRLYTSNPAEVQGWLPGGELHTDLMALLHVYLGSRLDVRLQLCVDRSLLPDATMSIKPEVGAVQLGRTAVMRPLNAANTAAHCKTITINLGRYERVQENIHRRETDEDGDYRW